MDFNSKTLATELRYAFSRFPQARRTGAGNQQTPLLTAAALFRRRNTLPVSGCRGGLAGVLPRRDAVLVLRLEGCFSGGTTVRLLRRRARIRRVLLVSALGRLLFFLFFLRCFLDS